MFWEKVSSVFGVFIREEREFKRDELYVTIAVHVLSFYYSHKTVSEVPIVKRQNLHINPNSLVSLKRFLVIILIKMRNKIRKFLRFKIIHTSILFELLLIVVLQ